MSIANWCVLSACILPLVTVGFAKFGGVRESGERFDNHHPREWEAKLTGWHKRAVAAQDNGFEALPIFIAAVLLAQQAHANQTTIDMLAISFIVLRILYIAAYLMDKAGIRTLIWIGSLVVCIALFGIA